MDGAHDLGGMHGFGAVPIEADEPLFHEPWEGRVWRMLHTVMGNTTIDRFRYTIEQMPPAEYLSSSYYERWLWAAELLAAEQGLIGTDRRPAGVDRPSPSTPVWDGRFRPGDRVRVGNPVTDGHTRVPRYLRRHVGRVERVAFAWPNPTESAATGRYGEPELVYTVTFAQPNGIGGDRPLRRTGIGVHRHVRRRRPVRSRRRPHAHGRPRRERPGGTMTSQTPHRSTALTPEQRTEVLERHLHDHGHVDAGDIDAAVAAVESASGDRPSPALGARVVARAWAEPEFRQRLLTDPVATISAYSPQTVPIAVLEDTSEVHNVIVCTLCSCYPSGLLGNPPAWYKSFEYRSRVVREPRAVLAEFGMDVDPEVELRVHDSTAEQRYLVLPLRPAGTEGWDQARLAALVTRNSMIGTGWALTP